MLQQLTTDATVRAEQPVSDVPADFNHMAASTISVIRRDQMPEDISSAFLPEDAIIFCVHYRNISSARRLHCKNRRQRVLVKLKCGWCWADGVCAGMIVALSALIWLAPDPVQNKEYFTFYAFRYFMSALSVLPFLLAMGFTYTQFLTAGYGSVDPRCSQCVKLHVVQGLASRILSRSSLVLFQRPILNVRSFFRFYKLFTEGYTDGSFDDEVDSCIRDLAVNGSLTLAELTEDGSQALLGLKPCQDMFTRFGWGLSWLNVLYQNYRDWKRWRLATLVCERLQEQGRGILHQIGTDGHDFIACLGHRGGHKWFLVDPELFIPRLPSRLSKA